MYETFGRVALVEAMMVVWVRTVVTPENFLFKLVDPLDFYLLSHKVIRSLRGLIVRMFEAKG